MSSQRVTGGPTPSDDRPPLTPAAGSARRRGLLLAGVAACTSGVAVFVNSYGVKQYPNPTAYTTAKNLVAALFLVGAAAVVGRRQARRGTRPIAASPPSSGSATRRPRTALGLVAIAVIGGSVPFVLFFEGLARASAKDAAFLQKTMVIWVVVLAAIVLKERVTWAHVAAIAALVVGQALLGVRFDSLRPGGGELMIMAATLLWSVEVVVAKRLLTDVDPQWLALARMGLGSLLLLGWLAVQGQLGALVPSSVETASWVVATGVILGVYVLLWYSALARAGAIDVSAVLVFAVVITALLDDLFKGVAVVPQWAGLGLVVAGCAGVWLAATSVRPPVVPALAVVRSGGRPAGRPRP